MTIFDVPGVGKFSAGQPFTLNDIKYPPNWLALATPDDLAARGITVEEVEQPPYQPTADDVVRERERRLALGFEYDFGDARGVHHIGTNEGDMKGWSEVTDASNAFIALGQPSTEINIVTNTGPCTVTALEFQQILAAATLARQPLWTASFVLQNMDPIPADYEDDDHWLSP